MKDSSCSSDDEDKGHIKRRKSLMRKIVLITDTLLVKSEKGHLYFSKTNHITELQFAGI